MFTLKTQSVERKLQVKNLSKIYTRNDGSIQVVLNSINIDVKNGEFVTIVGPSGCGKTTLLNILAGLENSYTGEIQIDGKTINPLTPDRIVVFQEAALFPWLTVLENVEFGLRIKDISKNERRKIATHYIEMVQLSKFANAFIHQLSGGMKQRVAIARALALNPSILLMDEPFAALDVKTRTMLHHQLLQIYKNNNKTILFVTHNINEAVYLGDRVIVLSAKTGNIKKEFIVDLPRPRSLDHPNIKSIAHAIIEESKHDDSNINKREDDEIANTIATATITM
jgi:ABC-type nitrate/sulfonate/bicarbonate transport system, ATPase component